MFLLHSADIAVMFSATGLAQQAPAQPLAAPLPPLDQAQQRLEQQCAAAWQPAAAWAAAVWLQAVLQGLPLRWAAAMRGRC